jgi:hypothetical protein
LNSSISYVSASSEFDTNEPRMTEGFRWPSEATAEQRLTPRWACVPDDFSLSTGEPAAQNSLHPIWIYSTCPVKLQQ